MSILSCVSSGVSDLQVGVSDMDKINIESSFQDHMHINGLTKLFQRLLLMSRNVTFSSILKDTTGYGHHYPKMNLHAGH